MSDLLRRRRWLVLAGIAALGGVAIAASATAPLTAQGTARPAGSTYTGKAFTFNQVVPGVYHAVGTGALAVGCNASVVVNARRRAGRRHHLSPGAAWALREEMKALTPKPVRYVVNTHWHWDHAHGNQIYGPDVEIIGHEYTRAKLAAGDSTRGRSYEMFIDRPARPASPTSRRSRRGRDGGRPRAPLQTQLAVAETQLGGHRRCSPSRRRPSPSPTS